MSKFVLVLIALMVAAPAAASGATWSAPVDVSSPSTFVDNPYIGFGRSGAGLAAWSWMDGVGESARSGVRVASVSASGVFGRQLEAPAVPVVYGNDRAVALGVEGIVRRRRELGRLKLSFGGTDGSFGRSRTIGTAETFRVAPLAVNDAGQIAIAYVQAHRGRRRTAKLFVSRGRRLSRPRSVSRRGGVNAVAVAVGPRGDIVVAWERGGRIEARIRRPGRRLGPVILVGRGAKLGTALRAAVSATGRAWITWSSQSLPSGGDPGPFTLRTAVTAGGRSRFRRPVQLDRFDRGVNDEADVDLALDGRGNGFVAWSGFDGQHFRAQLASMSATGSLNRTTTLSQPGYHAAVSDLATSERLGEALVVWSKLDAVGEVGDVVLAGYRAPGGAFAGEEVVSRNDRSRVPAAAFNPKTGFPTAVWSQREGPDGPGVPLEQIRTFLRASTRIP